MSTRTIALSALAASAVLAVGAITPVASAAEPTDPATTTLPVAVASSTDTPNVALATPSDSGAPAKAATPDLKLDSYDQQSGQAVLAPTGNATADPGAAAAATASVQPGQLIDSPPTDAAPHGALVKVTDVRPTDDGKVAVSTRPAALTELLGRIQAAGRTVLDPRNIQVQPLAKDLNVSFTGDSAGGSGSASAALQLKTHASVPIPDQSWAGGAVTAKSSVDVDGTIELKPVVDLDYQGAKFGLIPQHINVGFDLGAHADWHVTAGLHAGLTPVKVPLAKLSAHPVVLVGQLPVALTLELTLTAQVSADGDITIDTEQAVDGAWGIHAEYTKDTGWSTTTDPGTTNVTPVSAKLTGNAQVRTGLLADAGVFLYDTVGIKAGIEPYLRGTVNGGISIDTSGAPPKIDGQASLYGGLDVNGSLAARIPFLGSAFEKDLTFPLFHREWLIAQRNTGSGTPADQPTG
ncbi:hypothetical protein ACGF12_36915 [Kitasatospora sp. NPDC048296]|uniref:hypothetical protein n=1 Tax=Kitasatospora sp. NPDC048296 TaxID=3364048 RepID=UPI003722BD87